MDFIKECEEWLAPFGYELQARSSDNKYCILSNYKYLGENYPAIECFLDDNGNKKARVSDNSLKMFITMTTGDLQFKHPNIEKYIKVIKHYADVCENFPPF